MNLFGRFIVGLIFAGFVLSVVSIAWPKFTVKQRPELLDNIQSAVKDTPFGQNVSQVLGVSDEKPAEPINLQTTALEFRDWALKQIQNKADEIVARQAVIQISGKFKSLDPVQQDILRQAICQPPATTSGTGQ